MNERELSALINTKMSTYPGGKYGPSYIDQLRNISAARDAVNSLEWSDGERGLYDKAMNGLAATEADAWLGMGTSILGGISGVVTPAFDLAKINDTSRYGQQINDIRNLGSRNYDTYDQLIGGYRAANNVTLPSYDDIRGVETKDILGNFGSAITSGASAGFAVGNGIGAAVGAGIGALSAGIGLAVGDLKARNEQLRLKNESDFARHAAFNNFSKQTERIADNMYRQGLSHSAAKGGEIKREPMTLKEFADKVLLKQRVNSVTHSSGIVRSHCKGGTMVRIKVR